MARRLTFLLVVNLILSLAALGSVAWITAEPARWFDDVYAVSEQARESANELEIAVAEIDSRLSEMESRLSEIETAVGDTETAGSELEERVGEVEDTLFSVCSKLSLELDFLAAC